MTFNRVHVPHLQLAEIVLPPEIERLYDLAYNLWWTWTPRARQLFAAIDTQTWSLYHNPVQLLLSLDRTHWAPLVESGGFMGNFAAVVRDFDAYMEGDERTWFFRHHPAYDRGPIAYFSMEYGVHQSLTLYSGGLGVLSGDHCKSASDLGLPFVAVGLLYRHGYFLQAVDADGQQQHVYPEDDVTRLPLRPAAGRTGRQLAVKVPFPGREVTARVWLAQIGRVPLLLLDTDVAENDPADRPITNILYVNGREMRLAQELILGIGGARALAALGIQPAVWHLNEGHCALVQVERLRQEIERGAAPGEARERLAERVVFTTHTPVPAGNEQFDPELIEKYLGDDEAVAAAGLLALGAADHGEPRQPFNLTALALRTSRFANGVSRANAEVVSRMWWHLFPEAEEGELPIHAITNGVHTPTWLGFEMRELFSRHLGVDWQEELLDQERWAQRVLAIPDAELWEAHQAQKERLGRFARARRREQYARHGRSPDELRRIERLFDPATLTIGFARRFATYKRADLLLRDIVRLRSILCDAERPVQILFAGKAHPADRPGQQLIQHIFQLSQTPELEAHVYFLENYDIRVARMLVQGADVWLNTPRAPMEASGTSGQKAALNGALNLSVLDGWWPEGYDGENGWAIPHSTDAADEEQQDRDDAAAVYSLLEEEVVPAYYQRDESALPRAWLARMKDAIATIAQHFSSDRMVREYAEQAYLPLAESAGER